MAACCKAVNDKGLCGVLSALGVTDSSSNSRLAKSVHAFKGKWLMSRASVLVLVSSISMRFYMCIGGYTRNEEDQK